jgi:putative transposase
LQLIGGRSLRLALTEYAAHYHAERNHQGKDNVLLFPRGTQTRQGGLVECRETLGRVLQHYYHREAA